MKPKPIPQPRSLPILGNLLQLDVNAPIQSMMKLAKQYGSLFRLQVPTEDLVVVCSQHYAQLVCDESLFEKKVHGPLQVVRDYAGDGLITAHTKEPNWEKAHRILLPAFGGGALREMFPPMLDMANQLVLKWGRQESTRPIDVSDDMTRLTVDTIALVAFSYRLNSFYDSALHPFVHAMVRGLTESSARTRRPPFLSHFLLRKKANYQRDIKTMDNLVSAITTARKASTEQPRDMLSTMLSASDPVTGERLDEENIRYQMVTFLIAGHETTSGLLSFALYELMRNPAAMAKAREEVDGVLGGESAEYDHLAELTYLDQVLKETLRLWPTAPAFAVRSKAPLTQVEGYSLKNTQTILLLLPAIGRDPLIWQDPEAFLPERMEKEKFAKLPPGAWLPFGNGQRSCIGRAFALQEAKLALAMVLQHFDLRHAPAHGPLEIKESLTLKPKDFKILVTARSPREATRSKREAVLPKRGLLRIAYGSKTGTAEALAKALAQEGEALGFQCELMPLDECLLQKDAPTILLCSSYEGLPPENARAFFAKLQRADAARLEGLNYAVFGCGNKDWHRTYQRVPTKIDARLKELGARELIPRGEGDAREGVEASFSAWKKSLWQTLCREPLKIEILSAGGKEVVSSVRIATAMGAFGLTPATKLRLSGGAQNAPRECFAQNLFEGIAWDELAPPRVAALIAQSIACPPERERFLAEVKLLSLVEIVAGYAKFGISLAAFVESAAPEA